MNTSQTKALEQVHSAGSSTINGCTEEFSSALDKKNKNTCDKPTTKVSSHSSISHSAVFSVSESPRNTARNLFDSSEQETQQPLEDPTPLDRHQFSLLSSCLRRLELVNPCLVLENNGSVARDHLAAERTFLAYVRTSLVCATMGVSKFILIFACYPRVPGTFTSSSLHEYWLRTTFFCLLLDKHLYSSYLYLLRMCPLACNLWGNTSEQYLSYSV